MTRARLPVNQALLGLEHGYVRETVKEGLGGSLKAGFDYTVMMTARIFMTLKSLFSRRVSADNLGGIITIFSQSAESSKIALSRGLLFMAVISLNLAVINMLPDPRARRWLAPAAHDREAARPAGVRARPRHRLLDRARPDSRADVVRHLERHQAALSPA